MNKMLFILVFGFLSGCGNSGAPLCSGGDVQDLVKDISEEETVFQIFKEIFLKRRGNSQFVYLNIANTTVKNWKSLIDSGGIIGGFKKDESDKMLQLILGFIDSAEMQVSNANMKITSIRTSKKNDELKKSECDANLPFSNGNTLPITYTAQMSDDDVLYVEVLGL